MAATTVFLKNYEAPSFEVKHIHLSFDLYEDHVFVENEMRIKKLTEGPLYLHGDELALISIRIDGEPLNRDAYRRHNGDLIIDACPEACTLSITTRIEPRNNSKLSGLFCSNQVFCTQCEAEGFRRMTFFPDRPDVLTLYTTKISADKKKYPILLSNGNLIEEGSLDNGRHYVVWEDPFKKPSYLFALVAGELICIKDTFVTCSGREIDLRIYVEPGNQDKCAHAMHSLKKAMRWDEEMFGREYDLSIFMIVAVNDFNMGAMENKGLNIFNAKYILASPDTATDQDYMDIEGVVAHEYFHNWTGNRVTCRDWFQLSLKEGLTVFRDQEFSRDMISRDLCRIKDVKILQSVQFPEDQGHMAHPVRPSSYQEINNFYTATIYNKGAEVIRMQQTLLGQEGFRRGMDLYFERHDGQAVTIDDFLAAMQDANQVDFKQLSLWYTQAGTPKVQVKSSYSDKTQTLTLTMTQSCRPTPESEKKDPFHIPIRMALYKPSGEPEALDSDILELREPSQEFHFTGLKERPLLSLLRDFSAPIQLDYEQSMEERLALLRFENNGYIKWNMAQRLVLDCFLAMYQTEPKNWKIPTQLTDAFAHILVDESLDAGLRAELLTPPTFEEVIGSLKDIDVTTVEAMRDFYRKELALALFAKAEDRYQSLSTAALHHQAEFNANIAGLRKLRNVCLWLMMKADKGPSSLEFCKKQFESANNMTDSIASFGLLVNCPGEGVADKAIRSFHDKWSHLPLVMDKWFAIQASAELPGTLERVILLLEHPLFSLKNPNKVRALLGAFVQGNPRHFHQPSGHGYAFLADRLIELDKINPQIAARLSTPFTRWDRYDQGRAALMKAQLTRLMAYELSRDLSEIVSKSLQNK